MWIGLHGYGRVGKDTVGRMFQEFLPQLRRVALGDLIKQETDPLLREAIGISAFTDDPAEKELVRGFLTAYGYRHAPRLEAEFRAWVQTLPHVINTRILHLSEAEWFVSNGGFVYEVIRPGYGPKNREEQRELETARTLGLIHGTILNRGTLDELKAEVAAKVKELYEE